jgi:hypothetical protein
MCGYSFIAAPLRYGDMVAFAASLFVASAGMFLLGLVLERRWLRPKDMALAFTVGDPALAVSIALGIQILGRNQPCGVIGPPSQLTVAALWLIFGLWQWGAEVRANIYTRQQALSPTKIWHQLVIYPTLGTWSFVATIGGLMNAEHLPLSALLMIVGLTIWIGTWLHDIRHPRLGHPPYDWGHLRPVPPPWGEDSTTLRAVVRGGDTAQ